MNTLFDDSQYILTYSHPFRGESMSRSLALRAKISAARKFAEQDKLDNLF